MFSDNTVHINYEEATRLSFALVPKIPLHFPRAFAHSCFLSEYLYGGNIKTSLETDKITSQAYVKHIP